MRRLVQRLDGAVDACRVVGLDGLADFLDGLLDLLSVVGPEFLAMLLEGVLDVVRQRIGLVAFLGDLAGLAVSTISGSSPSWPRSTAAGHS